MSNQEITELLESLHSNDRMVAVNAIRAIAKLRIAMAVPELVKLLDETVDQNLKRIIVKALGQIGDNRAVPILLERWDSLDPCAVNSAFIRLGLFDAFLQTDNKRIRRARTIALRTSPSKLKELVANNTLELEDIQRVLPPLY